MNERFELGDVVTLKSGGQRMTVEEVDGDDISCVWFDGATKKIDQFTPITLKKVPTIAELAEKLG